MKKREKLNPILPANAQANLLSTGVRQVVAEADAKQEARKEEKERSKGG